MHIYIYIYTHTHTHGLKTQKDTHTDRYEICNKGDFYTGQPCPQKRRPQHRQAVVFNTYAKN